MSTCEHLMLICEHLLVHRACRPHNDESWVSQAWERRNINIKRFDEIPMADAEMVFPDKKIYLKPLLLIQLAIAVIGGVVAAFAALLSVRVYPFSMSLHHCRRSAEL